MIWLGLLFLLAGAPQTEAFHQPSEQEIRADATIRRAWEGRNAAILRICGDRSRVVKIEALDARFARVQQDYQRRFKTSWNGQDVVSEARLNKEVQPLTEGVFSSKSKIDQRCRSINAFAGALGEYQNGLAMAEAVFDNR